ncbi:MAG: mannitol dehydrogenase family protein [Croceibacterium sp.]
MRLSAAVLDRVPSVTERYSYDREAQPVGIVHFGIGAFHRAHQAWYTDCAMDAGDLAWATLGVSLRGPDVAAQLCPQDGLYTVTERSAAGERTRLIGAVRGVLVASENAAAVVAAVAAPTTRIVSLTVTEKGYCRAADGSLDFAMAGAASFYRFVAEGLRRRHDLGLPGLTLLSCDNLADNGGQLAALVRHYFDRHDPALLGWLDRECACPATMVDRIVPATTAADRDSAARALGGLRDEAAVVTEPFSQWIVEDRFAGPRPRWDGVGATFVADVAPYETAKLRMLNGAHSALAYLGLERGYRYVHEAIADPALKTLISRLMGEEAAPTIVPAPRQNLATYADSLIDRFGNPALNHRLIQIAMDGSQKLPQRWLATLAENRQSGRACPAILTALSAWLRHLRGDNGPVDDPRAAELGGLWRGSDMAGVVDALFGPSGRLATDWTMAPNDRKQLLAANADMPLHNLARRT